jgi:hypothetical protein
MECHCDPSQAKKKSQSFFSNLLIISRFELKVGLGLWNSLIGALLAEVLMFTAGIYLYLKTAKAKSKTGIYVLWELIIFLVFIYLGNLFGPPPDSVQANAIAGNA